MVLVHGPEPEQIERDADAFALVFVKALGRTLDAAAKSVTSTSEPSDTRRALYGHWQIELEEVIRPALIDYWMAAADEIHTQVQDAANEKVQLAAAGAPAPGAKPIPLVPRTLAEAYLATRSNYLVGIADEAWFEVRELLLEGVQEGEGIPELRNRVLKVLSVTEARATAIARTEVVGASNAGSLAQMEEVAESLQTDTITKTWLATMDPRTRPTHMKANGQTVKLGERFKVAGWHMDRPHAEGQAPVKEVVNCRCTMTFDLNDDDLVASAVSLATLTADTGGSEMPWHKVEGHAECPDESPWAVVKDDDGEVMGCHATEAEADDQLAALNAEEDDSDDSEDASADVLPLKSESLTRAFEGDDSEMSFDEAATWEGILVVEGVTTGDGREFSTGSLEWGELPVPLRWNKEDSHGGEPHTVAVLVGRIDTMERVGNEIKATGVFDLGGENGRECHRLVQGNFLRGVSIDADDISDADVEYVFPENEDGEEPDGLDALFLMPEKVIFHAGRIRAATMCDIPAFVEAYIELTAGKPAEDAVAASADPEADAIEQEGRRILRVVRDEITASVALTDRDRPPAEWFRNPNLSLPTPITIDDQGRVYGHAAMWGECHVGMADICVTAPHEDSHPYYMTGEVVCADGSRAAVGQITVGTGHAPLGMSANRAAEHYDNTGSAVADVSVGNDEHGIWIAGAIRPDAPAARVRDLRAAGQVSGDWRRIGGSLRLVGLLAVNVPGFPVPKVATLVSSGAQAALVAAGRPIVIRPQETEEEMNQRALRFMRKQLTDRVLGGRN